MSDYFSLSEVEHHFEVMEAKVSDVGSVNYFFDHISSFIAECEPQRSCEQIIIWVELPWDC